MNRIEKISEWISWILNPFTISTSVFVILVFTSSILRLSHQIFTLLIAIIFSNMIPLFYLFYLKNRGDIKELEIIQREKRINPLIWGIASHFLGYILLAFIQAPIIVTGLMFCYTTVSLFIMIITFYWKISVHAAGVSVPLVALSFHFGEIIYPLYGLIIIVGTARVILKKHTVLQVVGGTFLGLICAIFFLKVLFF